MIEVDSLCKSFSDEAVLSDLSLSVAKGEMVALIGKSGHGKSVLSGTLPAYCAPTRVGSWLTG